MKAAIALLALLLVAPAIACRNGDGSNTPAQQTFDAARDEAEQTPVDEAVRQYAQELCGPLHNLLDDTAETFGSLKEQTPAEGDSGEEAFATALGALGSLRTPIEDFLNELEDIDPPSELEAYHQAFIDEMGYALETVAAFANGSIFGGRELSTPPPPSEEPEGFDAALVLECGEELQDFIEEFGGNFFTANETPETTPVP